MKRCVLAAVLCFSTTLASASDGPPVSVETRAKGSQTVVLATVTNVNSRFGTNSFGDQIIVSDVQVDVAETLKGQANDTLTVTVEGGQINDLTLKVSDMPVMRPGERAVSRDGRLTARERQVLVLIAQGAPNKAIGVDLGISVKTVEKHRQNVMNKLEIHDTAGLTRYAVSSHAIDPKALAEPASGSRQPL